MKKAITGLALLILSMSNIHAGEVYKWIDTEGKVHFSARPPTEKTATVEIKKYKGASPAAPQLTDKDKQEWRDAYTKQLLKVDESKTPLNCSAAMANWSGQLETMLAQGKRNFANGSITQEQYAQATGALQRAQQEVSYSRCQSATGLERSFYECMSNDQNHFAGCGMKYNFSDM